MCVLRHSVPLCVRVWRIIDSVPNVFPDHVRAIQYKGLKSCQQLTSKLSQKTPIDFFIAIVFLCLNVKI